MHWKGKQMNVLNRSINPQEQETQNPTSWPLRHNPLFEHGNGGRRRIPDGTDVRSIIEPKPKLEQILLWHLLSDKTQPKNTKSVPWIASRSSKGFKGQDRRERENKTAKIPPQGRERRAKISPLCGNRAGEGGNREILRRFEEVIWNC